MGSHAALIAKLEGKIVEAFMLPPAYFPEPTDSFAEVKMRFLTRSAAILKAMETEGG